MDLLGTLGPADRDLLTGICLGPMQDRKLKTFKGVKGTCLTQFVEKYPEKKAGHQGGEGSHSCLGVMAYFEISNETMKFVFPEPGPLEGVKSRSKVILRRLDWSWKGMNNVSFTYPTKDKPTIMDVSLTVSQVSRVAVIGANGAGKSTAIKVLVGEQLPTEGSIWKAQGLRLAYVAQHAFHHLEKHMQELGNRGAEPPGETPTAYIMWRFAGNDDRESLEFKTDELSVDEEKATGWAREGQGTEDAKKAKQDEAGAVIPDAIVNRRQKKKDGSLLTPAAGACMAMEKTFEYEVKWQFKSMDSNTWVEKDTGRPASGDTLVKMGYLKLVQREDERQAAMAGLMTKQLTQPGVEKHLADFGVDAESASHTQINQLSGGMKVKVVLAAAMWQNPHVLILDEPTNYLDREGLGALILAIKDYKEFCDNVATEKWIMQGGRLRIEGESVDTSKDPWRSERLGWLVGRLICRCCYMICRLSCGSVRSLAAMFGAESSRHFQVPGNSYDVVDSEELEDGGLSHRWHVSERGLGAKLLHSGSGLRTIILVFTGALLVACSVATISAGLQRMDSNSSSPIISALQRLNFMPPKGPHCLKDEEIFAGICYMKCSLLTGGRAPFRVANTACCQQENQFFCSLLQSQTAISASLAVGGGAAIHNIPHAPGVGGICDLDEEPYQGLCYPKCTDLTEGKSPNRVGSFQCCSGSKVDCLNGKGTISSATAYGGSVIPASKDTGRSYKAINVMDARCDHDEDEYNGLCYTKCSELTYGKSDLRVGPGSCCNCGHGIFESLCCLLPWNVASGQSSLACCEFASKGACMTTNAKTVVNINLDKSQARSRQHHGEPPSP
eukprot:Skav205652  [mRNA]  locus=scaffold458:167059:187392:+ [translate_table: standard]